MTRSQSTPCSSQLIWAEQRIADLEDEKETAVMVYKHKYLETHARLMESAAREKMLRVALEDCNNVDSFGQLSILTSVVLAQPTDDSALRVAIQHGIAEFLDRTGQYVTNDASRNAALAAERERCINVLKNRKIGFANQDLMLDEMIAEIIALGD